MQNWKEPVTSTVYLANGGHVITNVNGISPEDGSGSVLVAGRDVKVAPLPDAYRAMGYGEIVSITLETSEVIETVLTPDEYGNHVAYLYTDESADATICLFDQTSNAWREMTEQEYERERRALEADAKDMAQIAREWHDYRNEGLGERG